jgi:hypothetical protein
MTTERREKQEIRGRLREHDGAPCGEVREDQPGSDVLLRFVLTPLIPGPPGFPNLGSARASFFLARGSPGPLVVSISPSGLVSFVVRTVGQSGILEVDGVT